MTEILGYLQKLANKEDLTFDDSARAFQIILLGGATPAQVAALLMGLSVKGESVEEISGALMAIKNKLGRIKAPEKTFDICGTGNYHGGLVNISTAVAIVGAACGMKVAKHGNRASSKKASSADVLTDLGVNLDMTTERAEILLQNAGVCYLQTPKFLSSMKQIMPISNELGLNNILNLIAPLSNPANPKYQLLGVFRSEWTEKMAQVLKNAGSESAWVVCGSDGLDEITLSGPTKITSLHNGQITSFEIVPEDVGISTRENTSELVGGLPDYNAKRMIDLFNNQKDQYYDIVVLNAAAALKIYGIASDLKEGAERAREALENGAARSVLHQMVEISNQF